MEEYLPYERILFEDKKKALSGQLHLIMNLEKNFGGEVQGVIKIEDFVSAPWALFSSGGMRIKHQDLLY